ncbi:MAG: hypothetical protein NZ879_04110 [Archaeoglobaceae archaeon]|nr:hypothetical protein [Archaeoglobaceae archaeon]MDW8118148.1 hypothetical protein [Archaeoglobaceae archaeon]
MSLVKFIPLAFAIALSFFHWLGIVISGALIGFISESYKKALLFSFLFALAFWLAFIGYSAFFGIAEKLLMLPLTYFSLFMTAIVAMVSSLLKALR